MYKNLQLALTTIFSSPKSNRLEPWQAEIIGRNPTESDQDVAKHLRMGIEYVCESGVLGDVVEFGTCTGRSAGEIAQAMSKYDELYKNYPDERFEPKKLFLFDSFDGLPDAESEVDKNSPHVQSGVWGPGKCRILRKEQLQKICEKFRDPELIIIFDGWFKDTVKKIPSDIKFCMVHVDCDLYQSTIDALDSLFAKGLLAEGAAIFFDDWNPNRASPDHGQRKAWTEMVDKYLVNFSDWGSYGWGAKKFLIHSYKHENKD